MLYEVITKGIAIIFISHFLDEVMKMSDKYIVLRDGKQVDEGYIKDISRNKLEELMVGRAIGEAQFDIGVPLSEEAIRVENLSSYDFFDVSFSVKKGEILGLAGLVGAGRTEVVESVFGARKSTGKIYIDGKHISPVSVSKMKENSVCFVTEDRRTNGIFGIRSVRENISAASIERCVKRKIKGLSFRGEKKKTECVVSDMKVSIPHIESKITNLSGGNQQKVILGRWLSTKPQIIILDEPTKGVDIGAKFDIHNMIVDLAKQGVAVIIVSSDLNELIALSHRILVMGTGRIVGEFAREEFDPVKMISLAASSAFSQ